MGQTVPGAAQPCAAPEGRVRAGCRDPAFRGGRRARTEGALLLRARPPCHRSQPRRTARPAVCPDTGRLPAAPGCGGPGRAGEAASPPSCPHFASTAMHFSYKNIRKKS